LAASFGAGDARAPNARRNGEQRYADGASSESGRLPASGPQNVDVWVEGTYAQFDTNVGDGDFYMLSAGIDYLKNEDVLIGIGAQLDWTDMSGPVASSSISGQGYLVGPYMTARLSEGLYFDGHIAIGRSSNEVSPFGVYEDEVNAERTYLSAALIGDIKSGPWTVRPEGRVTFFREEMDSYVDGIGVTIPSMEVSTGEFEFSPTVRYRYDLEDDATFTPFASIEGIWTFEHEDTAAFALGSDAFIDNGVRGRVEAGFDFVRPAGMQLSGLGFYDGLGADDFASWGAQLRVSWSFEPD
jgi:outer membrane autotransporter protein